MTSFGLCRYALRFCVAAAILAGCGAGSGTPLNPSPAGLPAERTRPDVTYRVLYSFGPFGSGDGAFPAGGLLNVKGTLYGTTEYGGASKDGTVYSITPSGAETVLHRFSGGADGEGPLGALTDVNGTLYGTTVAGGGVGCGTYGCGTVFSITASGKETVLHSFGGPGSGDGGDPFAGLVYEKGTLYGTTYGGNASGVYGTVFAITPSGKETVLHGFKGSPLDGAEPWAGLINVNGTLYGTTSVGGANSCRSSNQGCGTVFSITPSGTENVLYSFKGGTSDGGEPEASLLNVNGTLYGTTYAGGEYGGRGTVFSITSSGGETVIHSFGASGDGWYPQADLINVNGTLYGTTASGGVRCKCGTVYSITPSGAETVLHSFNGGRRGERESPFAGLLNVKGTLYGTTAGGGANDHGTVFSITP